VSVSRHHSPGLGVTSLICHSPYRAWSNQPRAAAASSRGVPESPAKSASVHSPDDHRCRRRRPARAVGSATAVTLRARPDRRSALAFIAHFCGGDGRAVAGVDPRCFSMPVGVVVTHAIRRAMLADFVASLGGSRSRLGDAPASGSAVADAAGRSSGGLIAASAATHELRSMRLEVQHEVARFAQRPALQPATATLRCGPDSSAASRLQQNNDLQYRP
jgi:hypothetical protein